MSTKNIRISSTDSGRYPFKVNDDYFDNLTARIMAQISEEESDSAKKATTVLLTPNQSAHSLGEVSERKARIISIRRHRRRNLWLSGLSIAASLALVVTVALKFIPQSTTTEQSGEKLTAEYTDDDYNEDLMTYTMVDNMDVYYYLASGEAEDE